MKLRIIDSLRFPGISERRYQVADAHRTRFDWVFDDDLRSSPGGLLKTWLRESYGIYWVSGKASSGKSTLMKHISTYARTFEALQGWADGKRAVCANHFF